MTGHAKNLEPQGQTQDMEAGAEMQDAESGALFEDLEALVVKEGADSGEEVLSPNDFGIALDPDDETTSMKACRIVSLDSKGLHDDIEDIERFLAHLEEERDLAKASSALEPTSTALSTPEKTSHRLSRLFRRTSNEWTMPN